VRIHILCVSKRPRDWVAKGSDEYLKRLTGHVDISVREIAPVQHSSTTTQRDKEAERLLKACPRGAYQIALDERSQQWTTKELSVNLERWRSNQADVACFIGGAEGLADSIVSGSDCQWSLSRLTLPHQLVRVILIEQLYRAWSVLQNHPYHRA
jgi:23S rRNA (pseudouridine1915-N3)-methyltransferase|tara:strand:+ start:22 stop:483 length:462 start_codon:yes stop_codon:yes gene_type:complete